MVTATCSCAVENSEYLFLIYRFLHWPGDKYLSVYYVPFLYALLALRQNKYIVVSALSACGPLTRSAVSTIAPWLCNRVSCVPSQYVNFFLYFSGRSLILSSEETFSSINSWVIYSFYFGLSSFYEYRSSLAE